ncbi:MAG: hypothetical protein NDJ72_03075, partial [Elusimicrobia bacterium]|nr:hypothetical protein [Elusimicrobiota bacterium]
MRPPLLLAVILLTSAAARAQVVNERPRETEKTLNDASPGAALGEKEAMKLKEMFLACKKTGDCKPYLLEKKKYKNNKDKEEIVTNGVADGDANVEASGATPRAPGEPAAAPVPVEVSGGVPSSGPPPTAEQADVMRRDAGARRERTMSRAAGAADTMRRSFFPAEDAPPGGAGGPGPRAAAAPGGPPSAPAPGAARTVPELALAARTGYAATFRDQGLKVGAGPRGEAAIQRADGAPASAADLERLRKALSAEPAALARRPDFFEVLPREKFADLKRDFAARPELRAAAFKDIGMTAGARDFQWSASCSGLSGSCNPHAGLGSYRKGQDVPPEDLDAVWSAVQDEILAEDDEEFGEYTEEDRRLAAAEDLAAEKLGAGRSRSPSLASLLSRMGELARSFGDGDGAGASPAEGAAPPAAGAAGAAAAAGKTAAPGAGAGGA